MADIHNEINSKIDSIISNLTALRGLMRNPDQLYFGRINDAFERLEAAMGSKALTDASFAFLAERDDAGRRVHSSRAVDYLTSRLGLAYGEAMTRLERGRKLFNPIEKEHPEPDTAGPDASADAEGTEDTDGTENAGGSAGAGSAEESEAAEQVRDEREAEEERRDGLFNDPLPENVLNLIEREMQNLNPGAKPGPARLRALACEKARELALTPLRDWLREQVRRANRGTRPNPFNSLSKRYLHIGKPDADGGVRINGYLDSAAAAQLKAAFAPGKVKETTSRNVEGEEDTRTMPQRNADHLTEILQQFMQSTYSPSTGVGSILITATIEELENVTAESRFPTNVGIALSPLDILRLGLARFDCFAVVDSKGHLLNVGRASRTANFWQRIALAASQLVCAGEDCDKPIAECDMHHLIAWASGGATNIANLAALCRGHHVNNNDYRDGYKNMGYMDRDPDTGRVGFRAPGASGLRFNDSPAAHEAPARRAARQAEARKKRQAAEQAPPPSSGSTTATGPGSGPSSGPGSGLRVGPRSGPPDGHPRAGHSPGDPATDISDFPSSFPAA
ncbi:HNH endonuclease signature motif containing protein [Corynebacterium sp.]|uniref:HNH endonuclease signature motif containing protein n=1 Tax=Corynebacterium sp. TaxID=1720 RepID=UPI0026DD1937|nr:HNH endonuclease signature motif containing protein [Corynebacterium sp.]MDO5032890.1 DUF222 domain-containing protein [Corynebacterium sp.]